MGDLKFHVPVDWKYPLQGTGDTCPDGQCVPEHLGQNCCLPGNKTVLATTWGLHILASGLSCGRRYWVPRTPNTLLVVWASGFAHACTLCCTPLTHRSGAAASSPQLPEQQKAQPWKQVHRAAQQWPRRCCPLLAFPADMTQTASLCPVVLPEDRSSRCAIGSGPQWKPLSEWHQPYSLVLGGPSLSMLFLALPEGPTLNRKCQQPWILGPEGSAWLSRPLPLTV